MNPLTRDFKQKYLWRAALRGCPLWMRRTVWVVSGYAWAGFLRYPFCLAGPWHRQRTESVPQYKPIYEARLLTL